MKFKPEDFQALLELRFGKQPDLVGLVVAQFADERLAEMLADAPTVFRCEVANDGWSMGFGKSCIENKHKLTQAKLVDIKPIKEGK